MKIGKAIDYANAHIKNGIDASVKELWLSELDGKLLLGLYGTRKNAVYDPDSAWTKHILHYIGRESSDTVYTHEDSLLVRFPFDGLYVHYLCMRTYLACYELTRYENEAKLFGESLREYEDYINRSFAPKTGAKFKLRG